MVPAPPATYRQHLELETPEHVVLDYELAGVGSRVLAALFDWSLISTVSLLVIAGSSFWIGVSSWVLALYALLLYAMVWLYFALFEGLWHGQTPGKRRLGIRTMRDTGHGITLSDAAARHLLTPIDLIGVVGVILIAAHPRAKRLGDMVAGTVVVRDRPIEVASNAPEEGPEDAAADLGAPELPDDEFALVREFLGRAPELPPDVRTRFAAQIAARFDARYPARDPDHLAFLTELFRLEQLRRRGRFGARQGSVGTPGGRRAVVERLVARKSARWDAFDQLAARVATGGLDSLTAEELPDFAARYREVAADLARVRTYGADARTRARLERLVAAGHNALYQADRQTWSRIGHFLTWECPRAVVSAWRTVALAAALFIVPGLAGYAVLREQPGLAAELVPEVMLQRAEAGVTRRGTGQGYLEADAANRPRLATSIIGNNVRVAFYCFASGILLGIGSLVLLAYNGLQIGVISGHFANLGVLGYLWTFIAGHGVLELFAIWVSGAAGFLLGRAVIMPGEMPRRDALILEARRAMPMVAASVVLLLVAGLIEGLISANSTALSTRLAVSGGSLLLLAGYLALGRRAPRAGARP